MTSVPPSMAQPSAGPSRSPVWIQGPWLDLLLFIGVPALLVPLILLRPGRPDVQQLILYVGAFGALGHHLPGMMRAYGDRGLFRRFRVRLILAPLFLVTVCVGFSVTGLNGIVLIAFLWTTWHTLMQVFGFARIYDAKVGSFSRWTSRLDHALCAAWIGAPLAFSDSRSGYLLELYYRCGGPLIPAPWVEASRSLWLAATLVLTLLFLGHLAFVWQRGTRPNPVKLLFFAVSFGFWWFCMVAIDHLIVGIALFDVFHDVQYLALVWFVQRDRVDRGEGATGFTRFLFRRSGALVGVYVGLVVAYGSMGFFAEDLSGETIRNVLLGVLTASALFHFYLDGFIWKVRERETRETFGVEGGPDERRGGRALGARHGSKWALFVVPVLLLGWAESRSDRPRVEWLSAVVAAAPESAEALSSLANEVAQDERIDEAEALCRKAIEIKPTHVEAHHNLGVVLRLAGRMPEARASFENALALQPDYPRASGHLGNLLVRMGEPDAALPHLRAAVAGDPEYVNARASLASVLLARGETREARALLQQTIALDPENVGALNNLAWMHATSADPELRDPARALELAERLQAVTKGGVPQVLDTLGAALAASGRFVEAQEAVARAMELARLGGDRGLWERLGERWRLYGDGQALSLR